MPNTDFIKMIAAGWVGALALAAPVAAEERMIDLTIDHIRVNIDGRSGDDNQWPDTRTEAAIQGRRPRHHPCHEQYEHGHIASLARILDSSDDGWRARLQWL
jgi:hypothetical protein